MKKQDTRIVANMYRESFLKYGDDHKSLLWWGDRRNIRYYELLKYADWQDGLLDIGCGFGDINQYISRPDAGLAGSGSDYRYLGVDVLEEFLEIARKKYGNEKVRFLQGNVAEEKVYEKIKEWQPAWAIASGIFYVIPKDGKMECYDFMFDTMKRCFELCRNGISFNFKTENVDYKKDGCGYHSPMRVLEWAYSLTRNVILDNGCMPFECTITLLKDDSFDDTMCFNTYINEHKEKFENGTFRVVKRAKHWQ